MFKLIDALDMKEGEMYFIKNREFIIGKVIFVKYHKTKNSLPFIVFRYP